jgi:phage gpG-like protein
MRFTFEVQGVRELDRTFLGVGQTISDLRPVWEYAERAFYAIEREQFASQGGAGRSGKWKELSAAYAKAKAKAYPGMPILQRTGRLMRSLTGNTGDSVLEKREQEFSIGSKVPYGRYHQSGTSKMPQRSPINFSEPQRTAMQKELQKGLLTVLRGKAKGLTIS